MNKIPSKSAKKVKPLKTAYDLFAPYYDNYMKHVDYDKWTEKILSFYSAHTALQLKEIFELACGTANISERLVKHGYNVTASDRSEEMVRQANQKANKPHLLQADMLAELPPDSYDLVLLIFDSINYLLDNQQILILLNNVSQSLRKQGLFIFDISTYKNSQDNFNHYINLEETADHVLIHRANFDSESKLQKTKLTIFKKSDNHYIRLDEEHQQRVFQVNELLNITEHSHLQCVGIYSLFYHQNLLKTNTRKLDHQYSRLFFVLKKV